MTTLPTSTGNAEDRLYIAGKSFSSRLFLGTGRYQSARALIGAITASGTELVTLTLRNLPKYDREAAELMDTLDFNRYQMVVNTSGCRTAEEAVQMAREARSMLGTNWIKLEVVPDLPDSKYLIPDPIGTYEAAARLVQEGFVVLPYMEASVGLAKRLQEAGCAAVMPMGSAIGSGQGVKTEYSLQMIIEQATVPVIVDAGLRKPDDAIKVLLMGASAVLVATAINQARDPALMGEAFRIGVKAGREEYLAERVGDGVLIANARREATNARRMARKAGLITRRDRAQPSCPVEIVWTDSQ
ncbi:thiazole synthase [Candidatus Woesearchaeota archaeon]|nr:thiazole synthase [Candidatus Woesearchaeota archaeon]